MKSFGFLPAQSNFLPLLTVSLLLLSVQSISACSLMTVTNENHHYIHTELFIHEKYLHGDMKSLAAQAWIRLH